MLMMTNFKKSAPFWFSINIASPLIVMILVKPLHLKFRLKSNANFKSKDLTNVLYNFEKVCNNLHDHLEQHNNFTQIGSTPSDKTIYGTTYTHYYPKGRYN